VSEIPEALMPNQVSEVPVQPQQTPAAPNVQPQVAKPQTYNFLQNETNAVMPIEQDNADTAIRSGLYSPNKADSFVVVDTGGDVFNISGAELRKALESGYRLETSEERAGREQQEQYGDLGGMAQSFGAGAARGATLGLSDLAASVDPTAQQHLLNLQEANPMTSAAGEITGFVGGSLLGSTESSVAARGAGAIIRGTEKLGAKAGMAVEKAVAKQAIKAGVNPKTAASIANKMATEATIGGIAGAGTFVSEAALGKADVNAENLALYAGMGAVIGGAFGASIGTATAAMPLVKKAVSPITEYVGGFTDRQKAAMELAGYTPAKAVKLKQKNPQMADELADFMQHEVQITTGDDAVSREIKIRNVKDEAGKTLDSALVNADQHINEMAPELKPSAKSLFQDLAVELDNKFLGGQASRSPEYRALKKEAESYYEEIIKSAQEGGDISLKELHAFRKGADAKGYRNGMPVDGIQGEMARFARRFYDAKIYQTMRQLEGRVGAGDWFNIFKNANRNYSFSTEILPKAMAAAAKGESLNPIYTSVLGGVGGAVFGENDAASVGTGALVGYGAGAVVRSFLKSDMRRTLVVLGKIERANQKAGQLIKRAALAFTSPKVTQVARAAPISLIQSEFAKKYDAGKYRKPKNISEAYVNMQDNFARYSQNPEAFAQRINRNTLPMYEGAPNTTTAADALAVQAALFIGSKLPKRSSQPGMLDMFNKPRPPSKFDLSKLERYVDAVENPMSVFENMERGRLSSEGVEALKTVYPNLYERLQSSVLEAVGKNPKMPYSQKLQLGMLLDIPTDESLVPENIMGLQSTFNQEPEVAPTNAENLDGAEREQLDTERVSNI
jgi:hypothetical protein